MAIALEDAYETLHAALQQLGPKRAPSSCTGEIAVEAARQAVEALQTALLIQIDRLNPMPGETPKVVPVTLLLTVETLQSIADLSNELPNTSINELPEMIIRDWLENRD